MSVEKSRFRGVTNNGSEEPPKELTIYEKLQQTYGPQKSPVVTDTFGRALVPEDEIRQAINSGRQSEVGVGDNVIFVGENDHRWAKGSIEDLFLQEEIRNRDPETSSG